MAQQEMSRQLKLMGKKRGMVQLFDETGRKVPCTIIEVEPNQVIQIKTQDKDGYSAIQLGFEKIVTKDPRTVERRVSKPLQGHFKKGNAAPCRHLQESRVDSTEDFELGQEFGVELLDGVSHLDVTGISKGKGFQGVIKLYNFSGGPASHGSGFHRSAGSLGMRSTPGRVLPGGTPAKRMGGQQKTVQNLKVISVDAERKLVIVEGAVPGCKGAVVTLSPALKKVIQASK